MSESEITKVSISNLTTEHLDIFVKTLSKVLSTNLAERTFSQVIDGLPTCDVYDKYGECRREDIDAHEEPCPDSVEAFKRFRADFSPNTLEIDSKTLQAYQSCTIDSDKFNLLLLGTVAVACHEIAAFLFDNIGDNRVHLQQRESFLPPPVPTPNPHGLQPVYPGPIDFYHPAYTDWDQYPRGISDGVGYWAESELFGGVVVFDRGESGEEYRSALIYRPEAGWKIFELSESQLRDFIHFGVGETGLSASEVDHESSRPIPFEAEKWARRVDPFDSMDLNIYRDKYERKPFTGKKPRQCVTRMGDDPGLRDAVNEMRARLGW